MNKDEKSIIIPQKNNYGVIDMNFFENTDAQFITSQIISAIATLLLLLSFQQKTHKKIVLMQAVSGLLFGIQYMMLGAYEGMICNYIGTVRSVAYSFRGKSKLVDSLVCPILFAVIFVISGIVTYKNIFSLLPIVAMFIASFVLWMPKTQQLRALTMPTSAMWLVYNAVSHSYVAVLTEVLNLISIIIALIRFRSGKEVKKNG